MTRIEALEARRLFAVLRPDVTWGQDGYVDRQTDNDFVASTPAGVVTASYDFDADSGGNRVSRYTAGGTPDAAFHVIRPASGYSAAADSRGRIYVLAPDDDDDGRLNLARYVADGQADTTWGNNGTVAIDLNDAHAYNAVLKRVALTADGAVYPQIDFPSDADFGDYDAGSNHDRVYKFNDRGRLDATFADKGAIDFEWDGEARYNGGFVWTAVQPDGRVIFVQSANFDPTFVTRYAADGTADPTYGSDTGKHSPTIEGNVGENGLALDAQGRLIVAETDYNDDPSGDPNDVTYVVSRFTVDGLADMAFGDSGVFTIAGTATYYGAAGVVLPQGDGRLIVRLGERVLRLTAAGRRDKSYGTDGAFDLDSDSDDLVGQLPDGSLLAEDSVYVNERSIQSVTKIGVPPLVAQGKSGTLYVTGTDSDENVVFDETAMDGSTLVKIGAFEERYRGITAVVADLGGGDDYYAATVTPAPQTVVGGDGNDTVITGDGDDSIDAGAGDDTVSSNAGYDTLDLGSGAAYADAGRGGGVINAYPGRDDRVTLRGQGGTWRVDASGGRADVFLSGESADVFFHADRASTFVLNMTNGATVETGDGNDSITTGGGPDLIIPGRGSDTVNSGAGNDTVAGEDDLFTPGNMPADDTYDLGPGDDTARDGYGNNTITGGDGHDSIRTGSGNDRLSGDLGRDTLRAGDGNDTITGGGGRDRLYGSKGNDSLNGGGNNDTLAGGSDSDTLHGGTGDDLLLAGEIGVHDEATHNVLGGGAGEDRYTTESDQDVIDLVETRYE